MDDRRTHRHGRPLQHGAGGPALSRPAFPTARRQLIERVPPHRGVQARFPPIPEMTDMTTLSQAEVVQALHIQALHISARRGWMVVVSAFVILFVTFGAAYSFTAFFAPLQKTFGASRGDISLAFSINVPLFYLFGAISGPLADRFGPRPICLFGVCLGGCGMLFAASATALWQIYVGFGLCLGTGIGLHLCLP